jgi:hypothetical protein
MKTERLSSSAFGQGDLLFLYYNFVTTVCRRLDQALLKGSLDYEVTHYCRIS